MNEFTKEELKTIFGHLPIHTPERENSEKYQNIYKKLQSMIDGYCEHENIVSYNGAECVYWCMDCSVVKGAI